MRTESRGTGFESRLHPWHGLHIYTGKTTTLLVWQDRHKGLTSLPVHLSHCGDNVHSVYLLDTTPREMDSCVCQMLSLAAYQTVWASKTEQRLDTPLKVWLGHRGGFLWSVWDSWDQRVGWATANHLHFSPPRVVGIPFKAVRDCKVCVTTKITHAQPDEPVC